VKNFASEPTMPMIQAQASFNSLNTPSQFANTQPDNSPLDVNKNAVEEISIITGGFQAEYGDAKSGVINIVTKEGSDQYSGNVRFLSDGMMPRSSDYGFNELEAGVGGPIPLIPFAYFNASTELQGRADWSPSDSRDEYGFHEVNQEVVDRINSILGTQYRNASLDEFENNLAVLSLPNPARAEGGFGDKYLLSEKITVSPIPQLKFIHTLNLSRNQRMDYDYDNSFNLTHNQFQRSKVINVMVGADWNVRQTAEQQATLNVRFAYFKDNTKDGQPFVSDYENRNTIGGFSFDDIRLWPEVAVEDIEAFLRNDYWINTNPNAQAILDTLDYMQWLDNDGDGQVDYWDYDSETF
jgi:hypothetical protein